MNHDDADRTGPNKSETARLRKQAWRSFDAGEFDAAAFALTELSARGRLQERDRRALIELLVDRGDLASAALIIESALDNRTGKGAVDLALELFDIRRVIGEPVDRRDAAMLVLELAAASADASTWKLLQESDLLRQIEALCETPSQLLEVLEQQALAPSETGLPAVAISRIEEIGRANFANAVVAREAERLLHAVGDRTAAYRVERSRRRATGGSDTARPDRARRAPSLAGLNVAIVGGYPALRAAISRDLKRANVADVREIPSSREGSRVGRDVLAVLSGADVAMLLVRQVGHSTSDQVKRGAKKVGVPVIVVESAGTNGVRRALEQFVVSRSSP